MPHPVPQSRRIFLQRAGVAAVAVAGGSSLLTACASSGGGSSSENQGEKSADNPFGVVASAPLSVVIFDGGYGDDYAKFHESLYSDRFAEADISHKAITDIRQQMQPLFNAGTPPDVLDNAGAEAMPISTLADTGQLADLSDLYAADAIGFDGMTVEETLNPVAIESGQYDDTPLVLNYALQVYGLWYDAALFDEKGWEPAETWDDFLALCEEIKGAGMAPLAHQGKYPYYIEQLLWDLAVKHGGPEVAYAIDSLEPGAWENESMKAAAGAIEELKAKGYMLEGTEGLDHIQSQTRWNEHKAAFITCGSWLENEQKEVAPGGFETTVSPTPLLPGAALPFDCGRVEAAEAFIVPAKAENVPGGLEYMRMMLSKEGAAEFTKLTAAPTVVNGATEGLDLTPGAASSIALIESGGDDNWNYYYNKWYTPMEPKIGSAVAELAAGRIDADEFCSRAQAAADETAEDPNTVKRTRSA
ncbi:N-acetylglucosamine/diacetylchitobiose ABC transporter substrate-binding protein [Nocardioides sp. GXQ0305]|uniref:N-acetylglucosamine/diacetylchitobiose ABC transporter substrate-binding protein n=1 Tax=Nocardioides sp. GXQ0305 TaxID=3423912 RepID=UPI003D7DEBA0